MSARALNRSVMSTIYTYIILYSIQKSEEFTLHVLVIYILRRKHSKNQKRAFRQPDIIKQNDDHCGLLYIYLLFI